jgi:hypothetical protein
MLGVAGGTGTWNLGFRLSLSAASSKISTVVFSALQKRLSSIFDRPTHGKLGDWEERD